MTNSRRVARNTMYMYIRMLVVMLVQFYVSRLVLEVLGVEGFGIYNLVAGIVVLFNFLSGSLHDATQRFITYEIGKGKEGNISKVFSACLSLHFLFCAIFIVIIEVAGGWFLHNKLLIPSERMFAAEWLLQFSVVSMTVSFVRVPFTAMIVAHEDIKVFTLISIANVFGKLLIAYLIMIKCSIDTLILYGLLMVLLEITVSMSYVIYSKTQYSIHIYLFKWESALIKRIGSFISWTIIGNTAYLGVTQGINMLLGMFFSPVVNAARGIAVQVQSATSNFSKNFQVAINPQITKTYAAGNIDEMHKLIFKSSKFSCFLMMLPVIPIIMETDILLSIWLKEVPKYTVQFVRIILLVSLINSMGNPMSVSAKATGNIKKYELYAASIKLLVIPFSYLFLKYGYPPVTVFFVYLFFEATAYICNVLVTSNLIGFNKTQYLVQVIMRIMIVIIVALICPLAIHMVMPPTILRLAVVLCTAFLCTLLSIYVLGLDNGEKNIVKQKILSKISNGKQI